MKRLASIAAIAAIFFGTLHCSEEKEGITVTMYGGAPSGLIIRSEPNTSGERLGLIPYGKEVEVLQQQDETVEIQGKKGRWTRVRLGKTEGWVFGGFLMANPAETKKTADKEDEKEESKNEDPMSGSGTVTLMQAGDHACYVDLKQSNGAVVSLKASFEICEMDIVNKKISYKLEEASIMADSCQGDPECTESEKVNIITSVTVQ